MKYQLLLPAPTSNIVQVTPPPVKREDLYRYMIWYQRDTYDKERHLLGSFIGNVVLDKKFRMKMGKIRMRLTTLEIPYHESWYVIHEAEAEAARRLDNQQRGQRKYSKCLNVYREELDKINRSSDLFKSDKIAELDKKLFATLQRIDEVYGTGFCASYYMDKKANT